VARSVTTTTASAVNSAGTTAFRLVGPRDAFGSAGRGTPVIARTRSTATPGHCRISWVIAVLPMTDITDPALAA